MAMKIRALFLSTLVLLSLPFASRFLAPAQAATPPLLDPQLEQRVLGATVQIAMYARAAAGDASQRGGRGLGTLVRYGGETLLVTHDHWTHLTPDLEEVEFRSSRGALLVSLDGPSFFELILYRDGGTMLLKPPPGLERLNVAPLQQRATVAAADVVWLVRRAAGETLVVVPARVDAVEQGDGPARLRLSALDGSVVIPGDSGGGVWHNGRLAGNLWAAGLQQTRYFWSDWFGGSEQTPTNHAVAALQPLNVVAATATSSENTPTANQQGAQGQPEHADRLAATLLVP
jgi:hypothetical protein